MTFPMSVTATFDTSLIDVQKSFSSTDTNTSCSTSSGKENQTPAHASTLAQPVAATREPTAVDEHLSQKTPNLQDTSATDDSEHAQTTEDVQAVAAIADVVDTLVQTAKAGLARPGPLQVLDYDCGRTARNACRLGRADWRGRDVLIEAWDASAAALKEACDELASLPFATKLRFREVQLCKPYDLPFDCLGCFDGFVSTLVPEHAPLETILTCAARLLREGGIGLVLGIHSVAATKMIVEAGTSRPSDGSDYNVQETAEAARRVGLELVCRSSRPVNVTGGTAAAQSEESPSRQKVWFGLKFRKSSR